jgi:hypothetical protein
MQDILPELTKHPPATRSTSDSASCPLKAETRAFPLLIEAIPGRIAISRTERVSTPPHAGLKTVPAVRAMKACRIHRDD